MTKEIALKPEKVTQIVMAIGEPALPMARKHGAELAYHEPGVPFAVNAILIPERECRAAIAELEHALRPATYEQARALARLIIGRYTTRDTYDFDTFVFEMTRLFGEAPADLGMKAADAVRASKFLPNVGDVSEVLAPLVSERRALLRAAQAHLREREKRKAAEPRREGKLMSDMTPAEREAAHKARCEKAGVPYIEGESLADFIMRTVGLRSPRENAEPGAGARGSASSGPMRQGLPVGPGELAAQLVRGGERAPVDLDEEIPPPAGEADYGRGPGPEAHGS